MRIAFVITSLEIGGAEMMLFRLVSRLSSRFEPYVLSLSTIGAVGGKLKELGVSVESAEFGRTVAVPLRFISLVQRLRSIRPHILQTWLYHADLVGTIAARLARVPVVTWNIRCSELDPSETPIATRLIQKLLVRMSDIPRAIVVNSHEGKRVHEGLGYQPKLWEVIPNGVDLGEFRPNREARALFRADLHLKENDVVFGTVARYHAMKDHGSLIRALAILAPERLNVHLVLAGAGLTTENQTLRRLIQEFRLEGRIHMFGERQDVSAIMAGLDCLVLPSAWGEGFPNVVVEAMACGVPCIVTDVGDAKTIVGNTGWVVPPRSPQFLASAMRRVVDLLPTQRIGYGLKARERMSQEYALGLAVAKYESLFDSLGSTFGRS